jgi:hypothetical protein
VHDPEYRCLTVCIPWLALEREGFSDQRALVLTDLIDERCKKACSERLT